MRTLVKPLERSRDPVRISNTAPVCDELEAVIRRFEQPARRSIRRLVYSSPRVADLANVFPGLLYALAARHGAAIKRRRAIALIEQGAQLREVARTVGIPFWLRRLPPEAFSGSIPVLPTGEMFQRRIVNHIPAIASESHFWLSSVAFAAEACNEYFAIWLSSQSVFTDPGDAQELFAVLAAYAWYSGMEGTRAHSLIVVPWRPEMAFDTAVCAAKSWLNRMRLTMQLREGSVRDPWLEAGEVQGLSFVPLLDQAEILAEAHAMQNCADQYSDRIARDRCRLFSVRRKGVRVATMEIGPHSRETGVLAINQLKGRHNMPAALDIWQGAHAWLASQNELRRLPALVVPDRPFDCEVWETLMLPYRLKTRGAPWLPVKISATAMLKFDASMADIARRGGVSSWLFT